MVFWVAMVPKRPNRRHAAKEPEEVRRQAQAMVENGLEELRVGLMVMVGMGVLVLG